MENLEKLSKMEKLISEFEKKTFCSNQNNNSSCPFGDYCLGKGNTIKGKRSHSSINYCPLFRMMRSHFKLE